MDKQINVGHPFYFPTQVVLVDDDADFLDGVSLMLDKNQSFRLFQSASEALEYVNNSHRQVELLERCYNRYKTGPLDSDALSYVDIGKLHEEIYNNNRFQTSATVVVDYSMPEMNGLEFLMELKNPFIRKVLLTGQADTELAIKAFNKQLIDQYIDKHDPRLKQTLNSTIRSFGQQYFRNSFKLLTDPIIANNHDGFLTDSRFQEFFKEQREQHQCVEYYLIDDPHTGYLMVDFAGNRRCLLVYSEDDLEEHIQRLREIQVPESIIRSVDSEKLIPLYDDKDESLDRDHPIIANWEKHYLPAVSIYSRKTFHTLMLGSDSLPQRYQGQIIPYSDFMEGNSLDREILH